MVGIIGTKLGMTQVFRDDGIVARVTVIEAGPCPVTAVRTGERDGYDAVQLAYGETRKERLAKPEVGHLAKAGAPPMTTLVEFRGRTELKIGDSVTVESFEVGQEVKVTGRSKGKGFQGTVRRHRFSRGPVTHGSHNVRAPGSIGASATPARVLKGVRMPGHMGDRRVTQPGLRVIDIDADRNLLLVGGSVPGARGGTVEVRGV